MAELSTEQSSELNMMASEITFYESTLTKLKSAVRKLKKARNSTVREYISDKITQISKSVKARSEAGSDIYDRDEYRNRQLLSPDRISNFGGRRNTHMKTMHQESTNYDKLDGNMFQNRYSKPEIGLYG